jgi:hypothetical protein
MQWGHQFADVAACGSALIRTEDNDDSAKLEVRP